jgi:2-iminobutanoate/2-iminopropanoate deaminase
MKQIINTERAPKPVGPYSQAVKAGNFLFVSGQLAIDPVEGKIIGASVVEQTGQIMENIQEILQKANYTLDEVVISQVYLSSMKLFSEFNSAYGEYFKKGFPARVTVGADLPRRALVEISVVAYKE